MLGEFRSENHPHRFADIIRPKYLKEILLRVFFFRTIGCFKDPRGILPGFSFQAFIARFIILIHTTNIKHMMNISSILYPFLRPAYLHAISKICR